MDMTIRTCAAALTHEGGPSKLCLGGAFFSPWRSRCPKSAAEVSMALVVAFFACVAFAILAHAYDGAKNSKPHDHGPSWAIYGQAAGETIMTDWECLSRPTETTPGKARHVRDYAMKVGDAYLYDPGVLHSPRLSITASRCGERS